MTLGTTTQLVMATLRSRCRHYIFAVWFFLSSFFSSPNLNCRRLDVYHASHMVLP